MNSGTKTCQENLVVIYLNFLISVKITFSSVLEEKFYLVTQHIWTEFLLCARDCIVLKNAKKELLKDERGSEKQRDYYISKNHIKGLSRWVWRNSSTWIKWANLGCISHIRTICEVS